MGVPKRKTPFAPRYVVFLKVEGDGAEGFASWRGAFFFFSGTAGGVQDPESPKSFAGVF